MTNHFLAIGDRMNDNDIFDLVRKNYATANADYIQRQIAIASAYLTDEQKSELWNKGVSV